MGLVAEDAHAAEGITSHAAEGTHTRRGRRNPNTRRRRRLPVHTSLENKGILWTRLEVRSSLHPGRPLHADMYARAGILQPATGAAAAAATPRFNNAPTFGVFVDQDILYIPLRLLQNLYCGLPL